MTINRIIKKFTTKYEWAKTQDWIRKPFSYALYKTWQEIDRIEAPRKETEDDNN